MGKCVATIKGREVCGQETKRGYKFCEEHSTRRKALEEREEKNYGTLVDATEAFTPNFVGQTEPVGQEMAKAADKLPSQQKNIYEKTADVLNRTIEWEEKTWDMVTKLSPDEMHYQDKAGAEQLHSFVAINERAQDRTLRAVTAIAKLNIDAQSVNINKMVQEVVKSVVTKSLTRANIEPQTIESVRRFMAEEFEKVASEAS